MQNYYSNKILCKNLVHFKAKNSMHLNINTIFPKSTYHTKIITNHVINFLSRIIIIPCTKLSYTNKIYHKILFV